MINEEAIKHLQAARLMLLGKDNQPISDLYYAIDAGIEAHEQTQWIPCFKKLPENDKYNRDSVWERSVLVTAYFEWDDTKSTFISMELAEDVINNNFIDKCIVAWMPLPKPYKGVSE